MSKSLYQLGVEIREEAAYMTGRQWTYHYGTRNPGDPTVKRIEDQARTAYGDIPELYARFELPHAGPTKASIDALRDVGRELGWLTDDPTRAPAATRIDARATNITNGLDTGRWHGQARDAFARNFAGSIIRVAKNQGALAGALASALDKHEQIRGRAHENIQEIGARTMAALKKVTPGDNRGADGMSANDVLTLVLTIADLALAIPTDGESLIAGVTLEKGLGIVKGKVAAAQTIAGALPQRQVDLSGDTVFEVISAMTDAIDNLIQWIGVQTGKIEVQLTRLAQLFTATDMEMPAPKDAAGADLAHENAAALSQDYPGGFSPS